MDYAVLKPVVERRLSPVAQEQKLRHEDLLGLVRLQAFGPQYPQHDCGQAIGRNQPKNTLRFPG
ncbi:hypothetical protein D3C72_2172190 [compost metagenome]